MTSSKRALLLVGSAKPVGQSTSESLGNYLLVQLTAQGFTAEKLHLHRALRSAPRRQALLTAVAQADLLVLAFPLYVDSLPYLVTSALELIATERQSHHHPNPLHLVALVNCGFPEARQNETALAICHEFARQTQMHWAGGLALGQGGSIAGQPLTAVGGMVRHVRQALDLTAAALTQGQPVPAEAVALAAKPLMPTFFYTMMGNLGWHLQARQQGTWGQLRAQPFDQAPPI